MIFLFTGQPRNSKSLNALKFVREDSLFKDRPIYYFNIKILDHEFFHNWNELTINQALEWFNLPDGSVIIIDECQKLFPTRSGKDKMGDAIARLDTHAHKGFDLIFITQHPMLVDTGLRRQVQTHYHFERQFGMESSRRLSWETCIDEPRKDWHARNDAVKTRVKFDKEYYGKYKSASMHNIKRRVPFMAYLAIFLIVATSLLIGYVLYKFVYGSSVGDDVVDGSDTTSVVESVDAGNAFFDRVSQIRESRDGARDQGNVDSYFDDRTPRVSSLPDSSPIYDSLTKPVSFPRMAACVYRKSDNKCKCYTQQATVYHTDFNTCVDVALNGYFDHTIPDIRSNQQADIRPNLAVSERSSPDL